MSSFSGDRGAELRQLFFESAQEILQAMNEQALRLEKHPDDLEALRSLRRAVHTLKGDAAACGFRELSLLAHEFEDALVGENLAQSAATVETALTAADVFGEMLEAYSTGRAVPTAKILRQMIARLAKPATAASKPTASKSAAAKTGIPKAAKPRAKAAESGAAEAKTAQAKAAASRNTKAKPKSAPSTAPSRAPLKRGGTKTAQESKEKVQRVSASEIAAANPTPGETPLPNENEPRWSEYEQVAIDSAQHRAVPVYRVQLEIDPNCAMLEAGLQIVHNILTKAGTVLAFSPATAQDLEKAPRIHAVVSSSEAQPTLARKCRVPGIVSDVNMSTLPPLAASRPEADEPQDEEAPLSAAENSIETPVAEKPASEQRKDSHRAEEASRAGATVTENLLRVDSERIDNVLNLVGELIIGRSMFQQTLHEFARRFPKDPLRTRFADAFAFQSRVLNDLQRSVMKIRMVPVEQLFRRFPRLVRDTARLCNKNVELTLAGQDTDLDKGILDQLAEPVAHLVRNAISHGIEDAPDRQRAGKPEHGTLRLAAYHQGNQVVIEIADDGKGLDAEKIRNKAVARGLVSSDDAQRLNESDLLKLIFVPGFSTAEQVTEVSGRGVGLDVVQTVMLRLKGSVSVESNPGQGTVFRLRLPLTLAIIKAILFRVEHRLYAVPLNSVAEMTRVHQSDIHLVDGHEVMQLRKEVLTLVRLGRPAEASHKKLFVLVVSHAGQKLGLVVDELSGQEELVIKALDTSILSSDLISGVSILGDGRVVLILNLASVAERRSKTHDELSCAPWGMLLPQSEQRQFRDSTSSSAAAAGGNA
jgi:two-component system chemotaxis sensor kinase CheA